MFSLSDRDAAPSLLTLVASPISLNAVVTVVLRVVSLPVTAVTAESNIPPTPEAICPNTLFWAVSLDRACVPAASSLSPDRVLTTARAKPGRRHRTRPPGSR